MRRLAILLSLAGLALPTAAWSTEAGPLGAQGEALFAQGARPGLPPPRATAAGGTVLPATALPCAGCHGADAGGGRAEAGVRPPPLAWSALTRATPERPAYDEATLLRAVSQGVAPGGRTLDAAMPRYALSLEDGQALAAWLRTAGTQGTPGVAADRVALGLLLPPGPGGEAFAAAFRAALDAAAPDGVFGRRIEVVQAAAAGPAAAADAIARLPDPGVLALVSALPEAGNAAALRAAGEQRLPLLALRTPDEPAPYAFALLPGLLEEAAALLRAAPRPERSLLVVADDAAGQALAERLLDRLGAEAAEPRIIVAAALAGAAAEASAILLLTPAPALPGLLAAVPGFAGPVLLPGSIGGPAAQAAAQALGRPVVLAVAMPPGHGAGRAATRFAAAEAARQGIAGRLGHAAGEVVVEALRRAGHGLTRDRLTAGLAAEPFETGALPLLRLAGGPRGAAGERVSLVEMDPAGRLRRVPDARQGD